MTTKINSVDELKAWWEATKLRYPIILPDVCNAVVSPPQYTACQHASIPSVYASKFGKPGFRYWAFENMEDLLAFKKFYAKKWNDFLENWQKRNEFGTTD